MAFIEPYYLRCEYKENPLGIDVVDPRLSWLLRSCDPKRRGQRQTAYRILVADSEQALEKGSGTLWDSGKVNSNETAHIVYQGKALGSRQQCWWKVRVWDQEGSPSEWSKSARWTMGLLKPGDWSSQWIGYDAPTPVPEAPVELAREMHLSGLRWIWYPEGDPRENAPAEKRYFRKQIELSSDKQIVYAGFLLTADNQFVLYINDEKAGESDGKGNAWQRLALVKVKDLLRTGPNVLAIEAENSEGPAGLIGRLVIGFDDDSMAVVDIDGSWKTCAEEKPGWKTMAFDDNDWVSPAPLADVGQPPWGVPKLGEGLYLPPAPFLRKEFTADGPVRSARVYASALGIYELHLNGIRVGEDYFTPGWTDYNTRICYNTYEIGDLLKVGRNVVGCVLADGWYAGHVAWGCIRHRYGTDPRLLAQIEIEFENGTKQIVVSDGSWKAAYGPLDEADLLMGETYDARKQLQGWSKPGFDDSGWGAVSVTDDVDVELNAYPGAPVRTITEIPARTLNEPEPGVHVFDLGQNMVGWIRLKVSAERGDKVVVRFAEMLNPDGTLYTTNLRVARATDTYYVGESGESVWEPRFTFHGFRYVEVTGCTPALDSVTGIVLHSATPRTGWFECSNGMVNQLYHNIVWGQRGNYLEVPTDCPQRDERLGWTGDAQVFVGTATYNMDVGAFFTKWLVDLTDSQREDGAFTDIAPDLGLGAGTPAWGDAGVICPYTIYRMYGDRRVLESHYEDMAEWIEYLKNNSENLIRPAIGYGDWLSIKANTPKEVIATAYFAHVTNLMKEIAEVIGKKEDAKAFGKLFEQIKGAFNESFVSEDGRVKGETQTCYAMALYMDLLPEEKREAAAQHLVNDIKKRDGHLSTGFVGLGLLMPVLTRFGHNDVAYRLLLKDTFPSWGYEIKHGATTIWERWDGWTKENGFQNPGMNSFNHYAFGAVGEWMFAKMAGIDSEGPGFKRLAIKPHPGQNIDFVKAEYHSIRGRIATEWHTREDEFHLDLVVPVNTDATVYLPVSEGCQMTESGTSFEDAEGVRMLRTEGDRAVVDVSSGEYHFVCKTLAVTEGGK